MILLVHVQLAISPSTSESDKPVTVVLGTLLTLGVEGVIEHSKIVGTSVCLCLCACMRVCICAWMHACVCSCMFDYPLCLLDKYRRISSAFVTVTPEVKEVIKTSDSIIKVGQMYFIC